jgi:tetratricopeptide (TPR) repeat protein
MRIFVLLIVVCSLIPTVSQARSRKTERPQATQQQLPPAPTEGITSADSDSIRNDIVEMKKEIADFRTNSINDQLKALEGRLNQIVSWGAFFLALFGAGPVVLAFATERRSREAHSLAIRGETAAQDRATRATTTQDSFLESSQRTLGLVNDTLNLAKQASERAADMIDRRANDLIQDLNNKSQTMLASVAYKDDRALVTIPEKRSNLSSLASKIHGFDNIRFILPVSVELTPPCQFILGLDFHLKQQFDDAFEAWDNVTRSKDASDQLKSLAWYWIGYENNNLENFSEAEDNFKHAESLEPGVRRFELQRIRIESRFFNVSAGLADKSIPSIANLLETVKDAGSDNQIDDHKKRILTTYGNILFQAGREESDKTKKDKIYRKAEEVFREVSMEEKKWAPFGLAQVLWYLGQEDDARPLWLSSRRVAQKEDVERIEPRTKVLARTTELICCVLLPEFQSDAPAVYGNLLNALGMVEGRLTVYSQFQKRNVTKAEFARDLEHFAKETEGRGGWWK